jgi:hypothetical protein
MHDFWDGIKRSNLQITDTEEGEEVKAKGIGKKFNKIIAENLPNLMKGMVIYVQEALRT